MKFFRKFVVACVFLLVAAAWSASGAEYFVSLQGRDDADGRTREKAFRTIQKGVDALQPGDRLTIGPGEYFENVSRADLGSAERDTVIRSEIPGMAVLRGDVPAPEFRKVDRFRFVYAAPLDKAPHAVIEHHTRRLIFPKANAAELEFTPGGYYYDAKAQMLYISNPDLVSTDQRRYTLSVNDKNGLVLNNPKRVTIDGLAATGFSGWGLLLTSPVACVIRNCVGFMNIGGINLQPPDGVGKKEGGADNLIEDCVCFGNSFGGIVRYTANNDVIRNCRTFENVREGNEHFGIMHYAGMNGPLRIVNNLSWGQNFNYSVKPGHQQEKLERNVSLGYVRIANMVHDLIGGGNEYDRSNSESPADNVLFLREQKMDCNFEFADALNLDFRLQPDSRFRGSAPDKSDRGPYPYVADIFYLAPAGDDQADGLSMRKPWKTLDRALKALRPGDTLYLAEGEYASAIWNKPGDGKAPVRVCGRGRGTVAIKGKLTVTKGSGLALERLAFADGLALSDCRDVALNNCTFFGTADGLSADKVVNLKVTHSLFADVPLVLKKTEGAFLSGNLYANAKAPALRLDAVGAVRFSDYNSYQDPARCWEVNGAPQALKALQPLNDSHSVALTPELALERGAPRLANGARFAALGAHSSPLGLYHEYRVAAETMDVVGPFVHSTSDTTANIEWWASHPASYALAWGETPEMKNVVDFRSEERFNTFSLTGLKPGRTYHFAINSAAASVVSGAPSLPVLKPKNARLSFATAAAPAAPKTYYVAPDGDDGHDGLSREQAFQTVNRAAERVAPGDTVVLAGGNYNETVHVRTAGTKERPISFRAIPGEKPFFQGENLSLVFQIISKPDIRLDGLYFDAGFWDKVIVTRQSPRLQVTRCFNAMIGADECQEMLVRNCVVRGGWSGLSLSRSPGSLAENNVFVMTILRHVSCDAAVIVRNNVFCECIRNKAHQTLLELGEGVKESNNCFYMRWPEDEKLAVNNRPLTEYRLRTHSNAMAANPMMAGVPGWSQGWQQSGGKDFDAFFAANPELVRRGIGLQPEAFQEFKFKTDWGYGVPWAEKVLAGLSAAKALADAGKNAEALAAYNDLVKDLPLPNRLKADVLDRASLCAQKLGDDDQAMKLARSIPLDPLAMHRQMELMLERKQYAELINSFNAQKLGGRQFSTGYTYPDLEDVMSDLYYYRSIAYRETGNLAAAEADLKVMNEKKVQCMWRGGEAIQDLAWLRLGDFYRDSLKDDDKALAAYNNILDRTTWDFWGRPRKPAARGADATLVAATKAVSAILHKQGKDGEIPQLRFNLLIAQAEAAAGVLKKDEMLARFKEALALPGKSTSDMQAVATRIHALAEDVRNKAVSAVGGVATGITDDTRDLLVKTACAPRVEDRDIALRALLMFAPLNKVGEALDKTEKEQPRKATK